MNLRILRSLLPAFVLSASALAADAPKNKVIDAFDAVDPKSFKIENAKLKIVATPDPVHKKALEMSADFAIPGAWYNFRKLVPLGTIDPKKFKAVRFCYKSDTGSTLGVSLRTGVITPEGRYPMYGHWVVGGPEWKEAIIPFEDFKTWETKIWKNGEQKVFPAGQTIAPGEYALLKEIWFSVDVKSRGTGSTAVVLIDGLELVPR